MTKTAIVGCGSIAHTHAQVLRQMESVSLTAFCDIIPARAREFSDRYTSGRSQDFSDGITSGRARIYTDLEQMLANEDIDVVHICTPHYLHVPMILSAVSHGVSAFCEKPPAISMEQFEELETVVGTKSASAEASAKPCRIGFCFQNRYNQTVRKAEELLRQGTFGRLTGARGFVTWRRDENYYETDWKGLLATEGGGALINQSIHTLDLLLHFLGRPVRVGASISNHHLQGKIEVEDTVEAWLEFAGGERACFYASTAYACDAPVLIELQCESGSISLLNGALLLQRNGQVPEVLPVDEESGFGKSYWGNGHTACIRDFYASLHSGTSFENDLGSVRTTMEVMMKIYGQARK